VLGRCAVAPGCSRLAYGESPDDPAVSQFERQRWSENPVEPPADIPADTAAFAGGTPATQRGLVDEAHAAVSDGTIRDGDRVGIDGALGPTRLALGVLAPLVAGATIVGGDGDVTVRVDGDGAARLNA
jgi:hypothetical protein